MIYVSYGGIIETPKIFPKPAAKINNQSEGRINEDNNLPF